MSLIIPSIFFIATAVQLVYWLFLFARLAFFEPSTGEFEPERDKEQAVSIIICAKNEAANLKNNLPRILNQNYRSFEVIVVNDNSSDNSDKILTYLHKKHSCLNIINLSNKNKTCVGKKFALTKGIEKAQYQVLLMTDADCRPASAEWLRKMQSVIGGTTQIGLGYAPLDKAPGFLNKFIRFEAIFTAVQYFSFALTGRAYMGVGRNLIYKKQLFQRANGFKKHEDLASGDDDLFINEVASKDNVGIVLDEDTFMYSPAKKSWKEYFRQKSRHLSTGRRYKFGHQLILGLLSASHFLHYAMAVIIILKFSIIFALIGYALRISVLFFLYARILKRLQDSHLLKWIPILDATYVFYYVLAVPVILFCKTEKWN